MKRRNDDRPGRAAADREAAASKKRARLGVIGALEREGGGRRVEALRLLAEVDLALSSGCAEPAQPVDEQVDLIFPRV